MKTDCYDLKNYLIAPFTAWSHRQQRVGVSSLPLRKINIEIGGKVIEAGVIDPGSQIIVMREDLAREVGATINTNRLLQMEGANGVTNWTLGCAEYLPMQVGNISFAVHAHVIKCAPFRLLLGRPFQHALLCRIEDLPSGDVEVSIQDLADALHRVAIASRPRKTQVASVRILTLSCQPLDQSSVHDVASKICSVLSSEPDTMRALSQAQSQSWSVSRPPSQSRLVALSPFPSVLPLPSPPSISHLYPRFLGDTTTVHVYKKVAKKVHPVPASLPEDFRNIRHFPSDPLLSLPILPAHAPDFTPGN